MSESRSIQVWPSGRSFTYRGNHHSPDSLEVKEGESWVRPSYEDYCEIYASIQAEMYLDRSVMVCQTSLVELLQGIASDDEGFNEIENQYREESDDDEFHVWNAGSNMPGYMPDEPPHPCYSKENAIESLLEDIERNLEESEDVNELDIEPSLELAKERLEKFGECLACGRAYFISEDTLTRSELDDLDCDIDDYSPVDDEPFNEPREVLEWWLVDSWLCDQLRDIGQPVLDNGYGTWWGRCTSGQSMLMDGVLQEVAMQYVPDNTAATV